MSSSFSARAATERLDLAVLKSWDFGVWQAEQGTGCLPYRMDHLIDHGIRIHWTDRPQDPSWQQHRVAALLRRTEAAGTPYLQTMLMSTTIQRASATLAMFESEGNFLALVRNGVPRRRRSPFVIISCWLTHLLRHSGPRRRSGYRLAYRSVDRLYYLSRNQGPLLEEYLGIPPERLSYLPFGVDTERFSPPEAPDEGYVLAVGRDRARDWSTFFEAVKPLDVPVKVCCRPSQLLGLEVPSNVEFLGHVDRRAYRDLLGRATVVAVITREVDYPTGQSVLLEAMAMARPVVVTRTPALADYIRDGLDCLAVPAGDPTAVREAIERIVCDGDLRAELGRAGRRSTEELFSCRAMWDTVAKDLFDLVGSAE